MPTLAQVGAFRRNSAALVTLAERDLRLIWRQVDTSSVVAARTVLEGTLPDVIQTYGSTAALLAADFYDELRNVASSAGRFTAVMAEPAPVVQALALARWGLAPLLGAKPDGRQALSNISGGMQRLVMQAGRETLVKSAVKDPVRTGIQRVPSGTDTCNFCQELADAEIIYGSEAAESAVSAYHDNCFCIPTPVRLNDGRL